jgi:RNA polymerase sigma factor (sigma-70 family)
MASEATRTSNDHNSVVEPSNRGGLLMRVLESLLRRKLLGSSALPTNSTLVLCIVYCGLAGSLDGLAEDAFRSHRAQIYRYLRRRTGDADEAEELTQEVFVDAAITLSRMNCRPASVLALLYTIARRRFADEMRRRVRSRDRLMLDGLAEDSTVSECVEDVGRAIHEAISRLPTCQGQVVCMKLLEGCSFSEIGALVGATEAAAKMRFHRGLQALRADLGRQGIEP